MCDHLITTVLSTTVTSAILLIGSMAGPLSGKDDHLITSIFVTFARLPSSLLQKTR